MLHDREQLVRKTTRRSVTKGRTVLDYCAVRKRIRFQMKFSEQSPSVEKVISSYMHAQSTLKINIIENRY